MNSSRARLDHAPALGEIALERVEQRRAPPGVVVDQPIDGGPHPVVRRVLGADVHEVPVRADLGVADRAAVAEQRAADHRRVERLAVGARRVGRRLVQLAERRSRRRGAGRAPGTPARPRRSAAGRGLPSDEHRAHRPRPRLDRGRAARARRGRARARSAAARHSPEPCSRPAAGSAHSIRYGLVRSQRTSAALVAANAVAPAASASNRSLTMFALVSPSISSARLIAIAARCAIARAISVSSPVNGRRGGAPAHSSPSRSPPDDQRRHQQVGDVELGPQRPRRRPRRRSRRSAASSSAVADSASGSAVASGEDDSSCSAVAVAVEPVQLADLGPEQPPHPARRPRARSRRRRRPSRPPGRAPTGSSARRPGGAAGRTAGRSRSRPRPARRCGRAA